jgi:hypothetical protein
LRVSDPSFRGYRIIFTIRRGARPSRSKSRRFRVNDLKDGVGPILDPVRQTSTRARTVRPPWTWRETHSGVNLSSFQTGL